MSPAFLRQIPKCACFLFQSNLIPACNSRIISRSVFSLSRTLPINMDSDSSNELVQESKLIEDGEIRSDIESHMDQIRELLEKEYNSFETELENDKTLSDQNKNILLKIIPRITSPLLKKKIDVLHDIQKKEEILRKEIDRYLPCVKNEAFQVIEKGIEGMSHGDVVLYLKAEICSLQSLPTLHHDNVDEVFQESSMASNTSDAESIALQQSPSLFSSDTVDFQPSLSQTNGRTSLASVASHRKLGTKYISDPLQFQLKRLTEYQAMKDNPFLQIFSKKICDLGALLHLQHEQLTIFSALANEVQKSSPKCVSFLVGKMKQSQPVTNLSTLPSSHSQNQFVNMAPDVKALTKAERKVLKQLKKEKKKQEKHDKSVRDPSKCQFYVVHKKRYCRMLVIPKKLYCGQHLVMDHVPDDNGHVRIPCPLDPKHSVYKHQLEQHLTVCNARAPTHLPYYSAGRNWGPLHDEEDDESISDINGVTNSCAIPQNCTENLSDRKQCMTNDGDQQDHLSLSGRSIADLTDEELLSLIKKVMLAEKDHTDAICSEELLHPSMRDHLENNDRPLGPSVRRHLLQNASLVAHLEAAGAFSARRIGDDSEEMAGVEMADAESLIENIETKLSNNSSVENRNNEEGSPSCFLEFGAGKGQLSHWVASASSPSHPLQTVLIDRGSQRYKFDSRINEADHVSAVRLRVDIADLALECVEGLRLKGRVFAGGKHLCGAATDLTVRCLLRSGVLSSTRGQCGLVIALCCHNRCSWQHYTGKHYLKNLGLGGNNFPALLALSSWAVCEARPPTGGKKRDDQRPAPDGTTLDAVTVIPDQAAAMDVTPSSSSGSAGVTDVQHGGLDENSEHIVGKTTLVTDSSKPGSSVSLSKLVDSSSSNTTCSNSANPIANHETKNSLDNNTQPSVDVKESDSVLAEHDIEREDAVALNRYVRLGLSIAEREEIGRAAKHLINHGRLLHLRELGLRAKLVYYVDRDVTLENVAIVAHT